MQNIAAADSASNADRDAPIRAQSNWPITATRANSCSCQKGINNHRRRVFFCNCCETREVVFASGCCNLTVQSPSVEKLCCDWINILVSIATFILHTFQFPPCQMTNFGQTSPYPASCIQYNRHLPKLFGFILWILLSLAVGCITIISSRSLDRKL